MLLQNILAGPHQVLQNVAPGTSDASESCHPGLSNDIISYTNICGLAQISFLRNFGMALLDILHTSRLRENHHK